MAFVPVIVCHPAPNSLVRSIAESVTDALRSAAHTVEFHDLYGEHFDPVLRADELDRRFSLDPGIQRYYEEISRAFGMVIVHPDWWGQPPALLKGWVDRVFRPGIAYDFEGEEFLQKRRVRLLTGKKACVFCTSDYEGRATGSHPLVRLWKDFIFAYCGVDATVRIFRPVRRASHSRKTAWLSEAAALVGETFPPEA